MTEAAAMPSLAEVTRWVAAELRDVDGAAVGEVEGFFVDSQTREPAWLIVRVGRRRHAKLIALPLRDCAGAAFGVWVSHPGEKLSTAPVVDPERPLRREHELTICEHFGIGAGVGRAAEVAGRSEGEVTASPPGG